MLKLWLVRHGQSVWNAQKRIQGVADPELSEHGLWQVQRLAQRMRDVPLDALCVSPQRRARQTAEAIAALNGAPIHIDERLKEHGMGMATGKTWEEVLQQWPHLERIARRGLAVYPHIPGAESLDERRARVSEVFAAIQDRYPDGSVAVVAHGGIFHTYMNMLFRLDPGTQQVPWIRFGNASLSLVALSDLGEVVIHFLNSTCHLEPEGA